MTGWILSAPSTTCPATSEPTTAATASRTAATRRPRGARPPAFVCAHRRLPAATTTTGKPRVRPGLARRPWGNSRLTVRPCERLHKVRPGSPGWLAGQGGPQALLADMPEVMLDAVDQGHRDLVPVLPQIAVGGGDIELFPGHIEL